MKQDYFDIIDTSEKAYWLGFLSADGCVTDKGRYRITFGLHSDDEDHLRLFLKALDAEDKSVLRRSNQPFSYVQIHSEQLVKSLIGHGCIVHKSLHLQFPTHVRDIFVKDYIRGYFDGDGSVYRTGKAIGCKFLGNHDFLGHLRDYLMSRGCSNRPVEHTQAGNIWHLRYQRKSDIRVLYMTMYLGAKVFLPRKKDKFNEGNG